MLSSLVKTPECGPAFETFRLESKDSSSLGPEVIDGIVNFDASASKLTVSANDAALIG